MTPIVWALLGARTGDNAQVETLAHRLGWDFEIKQLAYNRLYAVSNTLLGPTLRTVLPSHRAVLAPPWPDLVIAAGRRSVAPARWIKSQSGRRTKLVQIGRPRAHLRLFDLVITSPQYGLPALSNVAHLAFPLTEKCSATGEDSAEWEQSFRGLPRPWTGVLIGGATWPYRFDPADASRLAIELNQWVEKHGGSFLVSTSPRTPPGFAQALDNDLETLHSFHKWTTGGHNPYRAILNLADKLIVTGDSVSLTADACATGAPVAIWKPRSGSNAITRTAQILARTASKQDMLGRGLRSLTTTGIFSPPRLVTRVHESAIVAGRACWFDPELDIICPTPNDGEEDIGEIVNRIHTLVGH